MLSAVDLTHGGEITVTVVDHHFVDRFNCPRFTLRASPRQLKRSPPGILSLGDSVIEA